VKIGLRPYGFPLPYKEQGGKSVHLIAKSGTLVTIAGQNVFAIRFIPGREKPEKLNSFED
jgi:hypothetical protein